MKTISLIFSSICLSMCSFAQVGSLFPHLSAHLLDDKKVELPAHAKGKFTLLGMAYSKEAEKELSTWYQPVYETFIHKDKGGVFQTESYDIHLYLIPMFTGANQAAHGTAVKEMKAGVDKTLWPHLLVYKGELKPYKDHLAMTHKETPYFFVLDKHGKIIYKTTGKYTDEKMEEIEALVGDN